jgi:hypothetical protein
MVRPLHGRVADQYRPRTLDVEVRTFDREASQRTSSITGKLGISYCDPSVKVMVSVCSTV